MLAFDCSNVKFYASINLVMGGEKWLEVEHLPALGWGEMVLRASCKPRLCKTLFIFSFCIQILDKFVGNVELPSFRSAGGGSGWEGKLALGKSIPINLSEEGDGSSQPAVPPPAKYPLPVIAF